MILWFSSERKEYLDTSLIIETLKVDLTKMRFGLQRLREQQQKTELFIDQLYESLSYLRYDASVVAMKEYQAIKFKIAGEKDALMGINIQIAPYYSQVSKVEKEIARLEKILPTMKSCILEFRRHDR